MTTRKTFRGERVEAEAAVRSFCHLQLRSYWQFEYNSIFILILEQHSNECDSRRRKVFQSVSQSNAIE
jgi:hypothetical protein